MGEKATDGSLRYITGLTNALAEIDGLEVHVVTFGPRRLTKASGKKLLHVLPERGIPFEKAVFSAFPISGKLRELDADLIHCIGTTQPYALPALYAARRYHKPVIFSTLGLVFVEAAYWFDKPRYAFHRWWFPFVEKHVLRRFPIIALTRNVAGRVRNQGARRVAVIPPGIDGRFFSISRSPASENHIVCVSVIEPRKGIHDLLEAVRLLSKRIDIRLTHVGKVKQSDYYQELQAYVERYDMGEIVQFAGAVDESGLDESLSKASLFVLPSYEESFGLAVAEAMAAGVPVVATNAGGLKNVVEDGQCGLLVDPGSPGELASAMESILSNRSLAEEFSRNGRERASKYSWHSVAVRVSRLYCDLMSED